MRLLPFLFFFAARTFAELVPGAWQNPLLLLIPTPGQVEFGSGFLLSHSNGIFLVTARHVVFKSGPSNSWSLKGTNLQFIGYITNRGQSLTGTVDLGALSANKWVFCHPERDVAAIRIGIHTTNGIAIAKSIDFPSPRLPQLVGIDSVRLLEQAEVGATCYVLGYPTSITIKSPATLNPLRPLVRQAMIADVDFERRHIVLDCAIYKGNSGGPVMVVDEHSFPPRMYTIGIVSQFVPFAEEWQNVEFGFKYVTTSNSGYAIVEPLDPVIELIDKAP